MAKAMAKSGKYDGVVAIGTVVSICSLFLLEHVFKHQATRHIHDATIDYTDKLE